MPASTCMDREALVPSGGSQPRKARRGEPTDRKGGGGRRAGGPCSVTTVSVWTVKTIWDGDGDGGPAEQPQMPELCAEGSDSTTHGACSTPEGKDTWQREAVVTPTRPEGPDQDSGGQGGRTASLQRRCSGPCRPFPALRPSARGHSQAGTTTGPWVDRSQAKGETVTATENSGGRGQAEPREGDRCRPEDSDSKDQGVSLTPTGALRLPLRQPLQGPRWGPANSGYGRDVGSESRGSWHAQRRERSLGSEW